MNIELTALEVEQLERYALMDVPAGQEPTAISVQHATAGELDAVLYDMFSYPERIQVQALCVVAAEPTNDELLAAGYSQVGPNLFIKF